MCFLHHVDANETPIDRVSTKSSLSDILVLLFLPIALFQLGVKACFTVISRLFYHQLAHFVYYVSLPSS